MLKRNTNRSSENESFNDFSPLLRRDNGVLPLNLLEKDDT